MTNQEIANWLREMESRITDQVADMKADMSGRLGTIEERLFLGNGREPLVAQIHTLKEDMRNLKKSRHTWGGRVWSVLIAILGAVFALAASAILKMHKG